MKSSEVGRYPQPAAHILCCWLRVKPNRGQAVGAGTIAQPLCGLADLPLITLRMQVHATLPQLASPVRFVSYDIQFYDRANTLCPFLNERCMLLG